MEILIIIGAIIGGLWLFSKASQRKESISLTKTDSYIVRKNREVRSKKSQFGEREIREQPLPSDIELTDEFKAAIDLIRKRQTNLFITGSAGTGKSTLLRCVRNLVGGNIAVVAPTGLAAINVGGKQFTRFFASHHV